jgi:uncharacterized protein
MNPLRGVLLLCIAAFVSPMAAVAQLEFPKPTGWVNDFARVIDTDTQKRLATLCSEVDQKTHAQIAVVTVESAGGTPIGDYARLLFNNWGIGHKEDNRGVLILLSLKDRMSNISVGYGFERLFPNDRVAKIVEGMNPYLRQRNYSKAVLQATGKIASIIAHERGVALTASGSSSPTP